MLVRATCDQIITERGRATGAALTVRDDRGNAHAVTVRAKAVVVCAGAIHTPAILLRSGLGNANIGANLRIHPVTVVYGMYDEPMRGWQGAPMTRLSAQFADLDGAGYGVRLETAPIHPGIAALVLPWQSGAEHKAIMRKLEYLGNIIVLGRDKFGGRVRIDRHGQPQIDYHVHPHDAAHLRLGMAEALRVHHAAGAHEVSSPHAKREVWRQGDGDFEAYLQRVQHAPFGVNQIALFSAHQMSSVRIGANSAAGALSPHGETYEVRDLYVMDGSAMPTCSGVNPMISIMSLAHYLAQALKGKFAA
jgi:choline dehydrogenase-like flavoprotein